jgi:hypothetical protein
MTAPTRDPQQSHLRYVAPTDRAVGHLLPRRWVQERHRHHDARPSLCGQLWTKRWRNAELLDRQVEDCRPCSIAAGLVVDRPPVAIATVPTPRRASVHLTSPSVRAVVLDPQGAHARLPEDHRLVRGPWLAGIATPLDEYASSTWSDA